MPDFISTGVPELDILLEGMGYPRQGLSVLGGAPGCGRTSALLAAARDICSKGGRAFYLDPEGSITRKRLDDFGIDTGFFSTPTTSLDEAFSLALEAAPTFDVILLDGTHTLEDARNMTRRVLPLLEGLHQGRAAMVLGVQTRRENIGVAYELSHGLSHAASVIIKLERKIDDHVATLVKNRLGRRDPDPVKFRLNQVPRETPRLSYWDHLLEASLYAE